MKPFKLEAYWNARQRSVAEYASDVWRLITSLQGIEPSLATRHVVGDQSGVVLQSPADVEHSLLRNRMEWRHGKVNYAGYTLGLANGLADGPRITLPVSRLRTRPASPASAL